VQLAAPPEALAELVADYALLDGARLGSAEVLNRCRHSAPAPGGWIATNLASFEEVTEAERHRVQLACGRFADAREQRDRAMAPPAAMNIASILTALVNGRAPRELAEMFKGDVTLSFPLLRYTSMVGVSQGRAPESIPDAVLLLGTRDLHRWLCVLLADSGTSPISRALHETALTRGRLLELLALRGGEPQPEHLFMLGTFSLLDLLLDVPLQTALSLAPVPQPVAEALLAQTGAWRPYLDLALALEAGEPDRLDIACSVLALARDDAVALHANASAWSTVAASFAQQAEERTAA
jgi:EAL and modified HD-GYP domain-containing signal transduction protein